MNISQNYQVINFSKKIKKIKKKKKKLTVAPNYLVCIPCFIFNKLG